MYLADIQQKYQEYQYEKHLTESVLSWAAKQNLPRPIIHFELHTKQETYTLTGDRWSKSKSFHDAQIVVYRPDSVEAEKIVRAVAGEKITLFASADVKIVEILNPNSPSPLRHGLTDQEKQQLLILSRAHVENKLLQIPLPRAIVDVVAKNPRFNQKADVDVVMWVNGTMRGSIIKTRLSLVDAIKQSTYESLSDSRFKPVDSTELATLTLEINILSDLYIPLPPTLTQTHPEKQKGYFVTYKNNTGWYLPAVFNTQKYRDLRHLLHELATKKASINQADVSRASFYCFEVSSFAETAYPTSIISTQEKINAAADWVLTIQDKKGFIPTILSPYDNSSHKADWVRMALAALALNEYGIAQGREDYRKAAQQAFDYIVIMIDGLAILSQANYVLTVIYLCRFAVSNNDFKKTAVLFEKIESKLKSTDLTTITRLQLASLYTEMSEPDNTYAAQALEIVEAQYSAWQREVAQNTIEVSYAGYAELIPLLYRLSVTNKELSTKYQTIISWYKTAQQRDGSFPNTEKSSYAYTRGTGKICEAMSVDEKNQDSCHKSLQWILGLQYTNQNLFYIPSPHNKSFKGSIMHDFFDHSAWTDSVSHLLIGAARLKKTSPDLSN